MNLYLQNCCENGASLCVCVNSKVGMYVGRIGRLLVYVVLSMQSTCFILQCQNLWGVFDLGMGGTVIAIRLNGLI